MLCIYTDIYIYNIYIYIYIYIYILYIYIIPDVDATKNLPLQV